MGFDVGQSMGWSVFRGRRLVGYGTLKLDPRRPTASLDKIRALMVEWAPSELAVEAIGFVRFTAAHASYARLRTLLDLAAEERGLLDRLKEVAPSQVKKWATGSGRAEKPDMIRAVQRRFGVELDADATTAAARGRAGDVADAILVGAWATCVDE